MQTINVLAHKAFSFTLALRNLIRYLFVYYENRTYKQKCIKYAQKVAQKSTIQIQKIMKKYKQLIFTKETTKAIKLSM